LRGRKNSERWPFDRCPRVEPGVAVFDLHVGLVADEARLDLVEKVGLLADVGHRQGLNGAAAEEGFGLIPETPEQYATASQIVNSAAQLVANSPGAQAAAQEALAQGNALVANALDREAAALGAVITNRQQAINESNELYRAALRSGMSNDEAQAWALKEAAKVGTGRQSYQDVERRFAVKTHGQRLGWDRKRS
jgi:hypothetical protein